MLYTKPSGSKSRFYKNFLLFVLLLFFLTSAFSDNLTWTQATASADWVGRNGLITLAFDGNLWAMGGKTIASVSMNDVWTSSNGANWTRVNASAGWATRRSANPFVFDGNMWIVGGRDSANNRLRDVWTSIDGNAWTRVTANGPFTARDLPGVAVFDNNIWLTGGADVGGRLNDVWTSSDGNAWTQVTANAGWDVRYGQSLIVLDGNLWLLGGNVGDGSNTRFNDVWTSSNGVNWTEINSSANWNARTYFGSGVFDDKMWVVGGFGEGNETDSYLNDIWFSSDGNSWMQIDTNGSWTIRQSPALSVIFDKNATDINRIWVIGGTDKTAYFNDVWYSTSIPNVNINSPSNNSNLTSNNTIFNWTGSSSPTISRYYVKINNGDLINNGTSTTYNYNLSPTTQLPFTVDFNVIAESDIADLNATSSARVVFSSSSSIPNPSTCSVLGGVVCPSSTYCSGSLFSAVDTNECCLDWCILIEPPLWAPDLMPADFEVVDAGDSLVFSSSVFNYSETDVSNSFVVGFYSGDVEVDSSSVLLKSMSVFGLGAYGSEDLSFSVLKTDLPVGFDLFSVVVDANNSVDELDEFNNYSNLDFFGSDLLVNDFSIFDANESLKFVVSVLNDSDVVVSDSFDVSLFSGDVKFDSSSVLLDSSVVGGLSSRGLKSFVFSVPKNGFPADKGVSVFVDSNKLVFESDEFNNFGFIDLNTVTKFITGEFVTGKSVVVDAPVVISGLRGYRVSFFPELFLNGVQEMRVFGPNGTPVVNALVKVDGFISGLTDLDGFFGFKTVKDGKFDFSVFVGGDRVFSSFFKVKDLLIVLDRGVVFVNESLSVKIVDSVDLLLVDGVKVSVLFPSGDIQEFVTGENGVVEFVVSEVGEYTVSVMKFDVKSVKIFSVVEPSFFSVLSSLFSSLVLLLSSRELLPVLIPLLLFLCLFAGFLAFRALGLYFIILYEGLVSSSFERKLFFSKLLFSGIVFVLPVLFSLLWIFGIGILVALSEVIVFALFYSTEKKILKRKFNKY